MTVKVVTDSTADLPPELAKALDITVVPLNVHFGTETYLDGVDLTVDKFFERLSSSKVLPKTSQPLVGAFSQVYAGLAGQGHEIVSIHISAKLSGTCNSAVQAIQEAPKAKVTLVDSLGASIWLALVAMAAARVAQGGASQAEVAQTALDAIPQMDLYFVLDTLEYLQRGGRIGRAQALIGSLLSIKPILTIRDGEVHPYEKVRTGAKALARTKEIVREMAPYAELAVMHASRPADAEALAAELQPLCPNSPIILTQVGPVIGTHVGPGALGVAMRKA